jgi:hypothetical protein
MTLASYLVPGYEAKRDPYTFITGSLAYYVAVAI